MDALLDAPTPIPETRRPDGTVIPGTPPPRLVQPSDAARGAPPAVVAVLLAFAVVATAVCPPSVSAQTARGVSRTAEIPEPGEAWLEVAPAFESWNAQYALNSPLDSVADGMEEPLSADVDGPITRRLFPGAGPFLAGLRQDAAALGYDSLPGEEFSLGALDVDRLHANRRLIPLTAEFGVIERVAARITIPIVKSQTEAFFDYDSDAASFAPLSAVVGSPGAFADGWTTARDSLRARIESGSLTSQEQQQAEALLQRSGAFLEAFTRRSESNLLLPLATSRAGSDLSSTVDSIVGAFQGYGVTAPGLALDSVADTEALQSFFTGPMQADSLRGYDRGWTVEGLELGLRIGLLDTFRPGPDTTGAGLQLRTTIGGTVRLPRSSAGAAPHVTPASFLDIPVSEGQTDVEVALYQDVALGPVRFHARGRYGRQLADELELRVHRPDRPFPVPGTAVTVERDLGDYLQLHVSPRLAVNRALSLGAEYTFWRKEADRYALAGTPGPDGPGDPAPLAVETEERRHRLGVGIHYRAAGDSTTEEDRPVDISFLFQAPVAGSGGQTPVSRLTTFRIRVPVGIPSITGQ